MPAPYPRKWPWDRKAETDARTTVCGREAWVDSRLLGTDSVVSRTGVTGIVDAVNVRRHTVRKGRLAYVYSRQY